MDTLIGTPLYGYCGGAFGRDSYDKKYIVLAGKDWIVVLDSEGYPNDTIFESPEIMYEKIKEWSGEKAKANWMEGNE